ncbi:MAG: winged helix-turn-helix transcriptional regulator [Clostridiales bacterium]|nr:winged helix-turn-helix transcriptional regulator [Clostridiales bacterium]
MPHDHGQDIERVLAKMPPDPEFVKAADIFQLLCDPSRLRILWLLCHSEECVYNLSAAVSMSSPAVSHHLRTLRQSGLLNSRRDGKEVYYRLADTEEAQLVHRMIDDIFDMNCPRNSIR